MVVRSMLCVRERERKGMMIPFLVCYLKDLHSG